jgi:DNA-binding transcriptional LysR family regulator
MERGVSGTVELRHIRYFVALAEELNYRQAAERLHITQPPLSRQIQELEEEIGTKLFHRSKRRVELTNAGKVFLQKAYQILDDVEQAGIVTRMSTGGKSDELRVGITGSVQDFVPFLRIYRQTYPNTGIFIYHLNSTDQIAALHEKRIDLAIINASVNSDQIVTKTMHPMPFVATFPKNHPLAYKKPLYLQDLKNETFITTSKSAGIQYYETVMAILRKAGITPNVTIQAHDLQTVLLLVESGMGITLEPSPGTKIDGIVRRKLEDLSLTATPSLAWRKDNQSEALRKFIELGESYLST